MHAPAQRDVHNRLVPGFACVVFMGNLPTLRLGQFTHGPALARLEPFSRGPTARRVARGKGRSRPRALQSHSSSLPAEPFGVVKTGLTPCQVIGAGLSIARVGITISNV